jgi:hypothetical protein
LNRSWKDFATDWWSIAEGSEIGKGILESAANVKEINAQAIG